MSNHAIVHVEIASTDREAAGRFYAELFGWQVHQHPEMNYATFQADGGPGRGSNPVGAHGAQPGSIMVYVSTDDIEATLKRAEALGGTTIMPKTEIPNVGWFGIVADTTGNKVALFTGNGTASDGHS